MSARRVIGILGGSLLTLVPGIPFFGGIASQDAEKFIKKAFDNLGLKKYISENSKMSISDIDFKGILQLCDLKGKDISSRGGA